MSYHARSQRTYERAKHDDQNDPEVAFEAACLTNIALAAEADAEIQKLEALVDFHAQERGFGAAQTFCGVPMDEAIRVVLNHKKEHN